MKACIEFKDGTTSIIELPEYMRHSAAIRTGRPDRPENVTAQFSRWHPKGFAIFVEVPSGEVPSTL